MIETGYFKNGHNLLFYSYAIPNEKAKKVGIVFVHAAEGNKLGPHRMFVELTRKFNTIGYPSLRFDLSGCGDSTGFLSRDDIDTQVTDVVAAVKFFMNAADLEGVILFGISRGARVCFSAMATHQLPLVAVILLSAPAPTGKTAVRSFIGEFREYICKLTDPQSFRKLLKGQINIVQIIKTLILALKFNCGYKPVEKVIFVSECPILFIYGGYDPITAGSSRYYTSKCRENNLLCHCQIINNANHSFFHYRWTEEIFILSKNWLEEISNQVLT